MEICFPVEDAELRERVDQILDNYWKDNVKAREQRTEPTYIRRALEGERVDVQALFLERKRKKPDVDVRSLAVKTKTNSSKAMQREQKVGQPA